MSILVPFAFGWDSLWLVWDHQACLNYTSLFLLLLFTNQKHKNVSLTSFVWSLSIIQDTLWVLFRWSVNTREWLEILPTGSNGVYSSVKTLILKEQKFVHELSCSLGEQNGSPSESQEKPPESPTLRGISWTVMLARRSPRVKKNEINK
jgi:hypothetical protein